MARKKKAEKAVGIEHLIELNRKMRSVFGMLAKIDAKALGLTSSEFSRLEEICARATDLAKELFELFPELRSKNQSGG